MVSCLFSWKASLSLVPTPSVPETSTGSRYLLDNLEQGAEAADAGQHFGAHGALGGGLDAFDEGIAGIDIDTGIAIGESVAQGGVLQLKSASGRIKLRLSRARIAIP